MMQQDFRAELLLLSHQLQVNPMVEVQQLVIPEALSIEATQQLCKEANFPSLPEEVVAIYAQLGGGAVQIEWKCDLEKAGIEPFQEEEITQVEGAIHLQSISSLNQLHPKVNKKKNYPDFGAEELEDVPYFRIIEAWNDVINLGFLIDPTTNCIENELYYTLRGEEGFSLPSVNFQSYIHQLFYYKGFSDWQYPYLMQQTTRLNYYIDKIFS